MAGTAQPSPDVLQIRGAPLASARLSRNAALAAVAVLAVILGVIMVNVSKDRPKRASEDAVKQLQPAVSAAQTLSRDLPRVQPPPLTAPPVLPRGRPRRAAGRGSEEEARLADTEINKFAHGGEFAAGGTPLVNSSRSNDDVGAVARLASASFRAGTNGNSAGVAGSGLGFGSSGFGNEPDLNQQAQKQAFLQQARRSTYLNDQLTAPVSAYEIKTGTVIPSVLITELNSDLPGEIVAQVSQNVYDTASGNHLLIPQGTRLFGVYDSAVSFGQGRLLVSWHRLIYPNAATLELDGMSGHDAQGKSGLTDRVNNHYGRIFGWALLTSVISAGYQLSQPKQRSTFDPLTNQQVAAAAVGQQMAELGAEIARRNMRVQPTIEVRKGYRMNVMVNKDVVFPGSYRP